MESRVHTASILFLLVTKACGLLVTAERVLLALPTCRHPVRSERLSGGWFCLGIISGFVKNEANRFEMILNYVAFISFKIEK